MKIAFIGMGLMGAPMAANCLKAGHEVTVYNRTPDKCEALRAAGATVAATPAQAAAGCEAVLICVEGTSDVADVIFGDDGVFNALPESAETPVLLIDHSTISPLATEAFARRVEAERDAWYMDAPVSGGDLGAREGTLSIMCGGPAAAFTRAQPLLEAMGSTIVHIGERHGDGQRTKLINQMVVAINCLATTEGLRMGEAMGLDMEKVLAAISQGAAASWSLRNLGPRWLKRDFAPGFRLRHLFKDLQICEEAIESLPEEMMDQFPATELALDMVQESVEAGNGELNIQALAKIYLP